VVVELLPYVPGLLNAVVLGLRSVVKF